MYKGKTVFTSKSASAAFRLGYRFTINKNISLDLAPDLEFCFFLSPNREKGKADYINSNQTITTNRERDRPKMDIRTGIQADGKWRKYCLTFGYTIGHRNYYEGYTGGNLEAYASLFRIGLGHALRK